ncbi:MAG: hypothetical protein ABGY75_03210 [Gemmataceae bacterium]
MTRPVSLGWLLTLLAAAPAVAQFGRPPTPPPPPPVISRPPILPQQPPIGVNRPPTVVGQRPDQSRPVLVVPNRGILAVVGGVYAARWATVSPPPEIVATSPPSAFDWPTMLAVTGGAGTPPDDKPPPWFFPSRDAAAPPPRHTDDTDWTTWAVGGGVAVVAVVGVYAAVRPRGGRVRVFDVPPGEAPAWVRRAWVGVELPTVRRQPRAVPSFQVLSGSHVEPGLGYEVPGPAAVAAVSAVNPAAAEWWRAHVPGVLDPRYTLVFPADVCERAG